MYFARKTLILLAAISARLLLAAGPARAADTTIAAGAEYTLTGDLVLAPTDSLTAGDTSGARCKIHGGGFSIKSADDPQDENPWTATLSIQNCDIDGLGTATAAAISLTGTGAVTIQGSDFSTSGQLAFTMSGGMSVIFQHNVIQADSVVPQVVSELDSPPSFYVSGISTGTKLFQSNTVLSGRIDFESTSDWLIGGDTPADGNVLVGIRTGILMEYSNNMTVRGNYSHTITGPLIDGNGWNQVKNLSIINGGGAVIEHNVFRGLNWLIEMYGGGELRYNLLLDAVERGWVLFGAQSGIKIHHNVLIADKVNQFVPAGGFVLEDEGQDATPDCEIYNNTLDANGVCDPGLSQGAVVFHGMPVLLSLRSNFFTGIRQDPAREGALVEEYDTNIAVIGMPPAVRLGYSDYNFFYNPDSQVKQVYGVSVDGKTLGLDPGFGLHDVPVGGSSDMTVKPGLANPMTPHTFPFNDADVIAGTTTACQVLAYYRQVYTPAAGSPLVDTGDPMEGAGNDIGAVGAGMDNDLDQFGRTFCDPQDIGQPTLDPASYTCASVPVVSGGGGGDVGPPLVTGINCVCALDAGGATPAAWALAAAAAALALSRRRATRRSPTGRRR